MSGHGQTD